MSYTAPNEDIPFGIFSAKNKKQLLRLISKTPSSARYFLRYDNKTKRWNEGKKRFSKRLKNGSGVLKKSRVDF